MAALDGYAKAASWAGDAHGLLLNPERKVRRVGCERHLTRLRRTVLILSAWKTNVAAGSVETTMGRYRDHREPRGHRHGDNFSSFPESSEPSYFQRVPTVATQPVDAEVMWFNATKGFGFIKLSDGREAYLHVRALEAAGSHSVSEGTSLKVTIEKSPKGQQVAKGLEIGYQMTRSPARPRSGCEPSAATDTRLDGEGTVKWYNAQKGFGFIAPDNGEKDVFVHATTLSRSGLSVLEEGQKVFIEYGQGKKGLEVRSVRLV